MREGERVSAEPGDTHSLLSLLAGIDGESVEHCEDLLRPQIERYPNVSNNEGRPWQFQMLKQTSCKPAASDNGRLCAF